MRLGEADKNTLTPALSHQGAREKRAIRHVPPCRGRPACRPKKGIPLTPALSHQGRGFFLSFPQVFSGNPGSLFLVLLPLPTVGEGWGEGAKTLDARSGSGMTGGGKVDEKRQ